MCLTLGEIMDKLTGNATQTEEELRFCHMFWDASVHRWHVLVFPKWAVFPASWLTELAYTIVEVETYPQRHLDIRQLSKNWTEMEKVMQDSLEK